MSGLFSPYSFRGLHLPNRVVVSPMCQYSADNGEAGAWHMVHIGGLALSGAGMFCIEASAVEAEGRITPGDLGIWNDATEVALRPIVAAVREISPVAIVMQLAHAGRKASCRVPWQGGEQIPIVAGGWLAAAPSAIPHNPGEEAPAALDKSGLARIRGAFADAARRAERLKLDGLELHSAHGYLLHEFLSPISNRRVDEYGGSLENRMRFPLEVFDAVRDVFPKDKPVGVRVSATDWVDGGWDLEQTIAYARELQRRGVDWVDCSSGGISPLQKIPTVPGYQVEFARAVKKAANVNTVAVGLITEPHLAQDIIENGSADLVALARGMLYDPRWGWHAAAELGATIAGPPQYWRAPPHEHKHLFNDTLRASR